MKNLLFALTLLISGTVFSQNKVETVSIKTSTTCDHCKVCETCGGLIEKSMSYVKGIKKVTYNEADMTISVVYNTQKLTLDQIRQEIAKLGFSADHIPADPTGFEKRDGCCKGS